MISKQLFIDSIAALEKQYKIDLNARDLFKTIFAGSGTMMYDNSTLKDQAIKLLESSIGGDDNGWIEYFVYDLNFGKDYKRGCVTWEGKSLDISDAGKLYDFLTMLNKTGDDKCK